MLPTHPLSLASATSLCRLLPGCAVEELAIFIELARRSLVLDASSLIAAVLFAQPLVVAWRPCWKFAYLVGLSLGVKYTTEGFYISDIVTFCTNEFPLLHLKYGEMLAMDLVNWSDLSTRFLGTRNDLMRTALALPPVQDYHLMEATRNCVLNEEDSGLHVLLVLEPQVSQEVHKTISVIQPNAVVNEFSRCGAIRSQRIA
ncbi:MAG: hypothetical protein SGPRY_014594, partial [Prymnesium sp.]